MAKTPFYKVIIKKSGRDISDLISKFSHEDAVDEDNLLILQLDDSKTDIIDDPDLKEGEILSFQYGFTQGKSSPTYVARIIDIIPNYVDVIKITIRATDLGISLKKNSSKKVWQNMKASDMVKQIALANGLIPVVEETETVHVSMPQAGKSDYSFIKYLAKIEKDGSWRFYLRNDELHFTRLKLETESAKTLRWNNGDGTVKNFKPYSQESLKKAASRETVVTTVDPFTNKPVQNVVNNTTAKDDVKLGEYVYDFNGTQEAFRIDKSTRPSQIKKAQEDTNKTGQHVYTPAGVLAEAENIGNKIKKKSSLGDYMASLTIIGDPDYVADQIITMAGVAKKDTGNWYVSRANHTIDPSGSYSTRLTLNKNAGKKKIGDGSKADAANVNKTTGPDSKENAPVKKEVELIYFDENANRVDRP